MSFFDSLWTAQKAYWYGLSGATIAPLYALGGVINEATGGTTPTYDVFEAVRLQTQQEPVQPTLSPTVEALSLYDPGNTLGDVAPGTNPWAGGGADGGGGLQPPVLNEFGVQAATQLLKKAVDAVLPDWLLPVAVGAGAFLLLKDR